MLNALIPLFPALHTLEPLGLPASALADWHATVNQQQAARLARHLEREFRAVAEAHAGQVDHAYLRSDAFRANVVQAVRAAEVAESDDKLRFIARALAGCVLRFPPPAPDRFQTLRIVEALSDRETRVFAGLYTVLDPIAPNDDAVTVGSAATAAGLTRHEATAALLGLAQLGLLVRDEGEVWKLTALARQVAALGQLTEDPL